MLPKVRLFMKFMIGIHRNYSFTSISFPDTFWLFDTKIHFLSYQKAENGLETGLKYKQSLFFMFYNNNLVLKKKKCYKLHFRSDACRTSVALRQFNEPSNQRAHKSDCRLSKNSGQS